MAGRRSGLRALSFAAALALFAAGARAEGAAPSEPAEVVSAREAFRLGSALTKQAQWLDALVAFRRSAALNPHPITTYNIAYCERALGHYARAFERFEAALEPASSPDAPTLPPELVRGARTYVAEVERRLARVKVTLGDPGTTVRVDGLPIEPMHPSEGAVVFIVAADDTGPVASLPSSLDLWLDPGTHVFIVTNSQGGRLVESHTLEAGASVAMEFAWTPAPAPAPAPVPASPPPLALAGGGRASEPAAARESHADHRPALFAFGAGAAGLAAGGIFAGLALDEKSTLDSDRQCADRLCPDDAAHRDREARMRTFSDLATAGLAVGVVGAAVGTYLWLTAKSGDRGARSSNSRTVVPWVGVRSAGVLGRF